MFNAFTYDSDFANKIGKELDRGNGLLYIHETPGRATHVLMTLDRLHELVGHDPGHNDDLIHCHLYAD